jgi:transcriptional regulator with XRE-family HTH domain
MRRRHADLHVSDGGLRPYRSSHIRVSVITYTAVVDATESKAVPPSAVSPDGSVGARVKSLREAMDLSLRDLAERSGVSAPMLSQVERGDTSPTLAVAQKIAAGLDLTLSQLLRLDEDRHVVVVRVRDRRTRRRRGHKVEELTPPLPGQRSDVSEHTLAPGAATGAPDDPPVHEPGSRETAVVLDGKVELLIDGQRHELAEGDSVTFDADLPHHFENNSSSQARLIAVVAAGLRRG